MLRPALYLLYRDPDNLQTSSNVSYNAVVRDSGRGQGAEESEYEVPDLPSQPPPSGGLYEPVWHTSGTCVYTIVASIMPLANM